MSAALTTAAGHMVCPDVVIADSIPARLRGLLGRSELRPGQGLLLQPAGSVHTAFMRFAIDAVFLDRDLRVIGVEAHLKPWKIAGRRRARAVLELSAGEAGRAGIESGMQFAIEASSTGRGR